MSSRYAGLSPSDRIHFITRLYLSGMISASNCSKFSPKAGSVKGKGEEIASTTVELPLRLLYSAIFSFSNRNAVWKNGVSSPRLQVVRRLLSLLDRLI